MDEYELFEALFLVAAGIALVLFIIGIVVIALGVMGLAVVSGI